MGINRDVASADRVAERHPSLCVSVLVVCVVPLLCVSVPGSGAREATLCPVLNDLKKKYVPFSNINILFTMLLRCIEFA